MILTNKGRDLQAKAEAGAVLNFTKVKIGDGQLAQGQTLETLNDLINPLKILGITSVQAEAGGLCRIRANITNQGVTQGFYVREVGLFAQDPDLGEILYAIATATAADYLPPEGGATVVNNQFDIIVVVGNASQITATITTTGTASQADLNAVKGDLGDKSILTTTDKSSIVGAINEVRSQVVALAGAPDPYPQYALDADLNNLAGAGRTNETVKGNADALAAHLAETVQAHGDHDSQDILLTRDANGKLTGIDVKKPDDLGVSRITATLSFDANGRLSSVLEKELDTDGTTVKSQATTTILRDVNGRITELEVR